MKFALFITIFSLISCSGMNNNRKTASVVNSSEINSQLLEMALASYKLNQSKISNHNHIVIVDFSKSSSEERLYVYDLKKAEAEKTLVSHGSGSDKNKDGNVELFSNVPMTYASPRGSMILGKIKRTSQGIGFELHGLDYEVNHNTFDRVIQFHGSKYVTDTKAPNSKGSFSVSEEFFNKYRKVLTQGTLFFVDKVKD